MRLPIQQGCRGTLIGAHFVVDTGGTFADTNPQVDTFRESPILTGKSVYA